MALEIKNIHAEVEGKEILKGISLECQTKEVHVIMGPNGSGKSTLANVLMGHPKYKLTKGKIILDKKNITNAKTDQRAKEGLFLSFQHPLEIEGVTITNLLKTAKQSKTGKKIPILKFSREISEKMEELNIDISLRTREVNKGFSGGEKKRTEMLQLLTLEPKYAILDEIDSGLDVDGIKVVARAIKKAQEKGTGIIIITHYNRILHEIKADKVSILYKGKIVMTGTQELAEKIEKEGFEQFIE